jgi:hypothetical protein
MVGIDAVIPEPAALGGGQASAGLEVRFVAGQSAVIRQHATAPLKLLVPCPRGQSVWAYTSSLGGGLVAGDQVHLDVHVAAGARCFLSTQASTKVYRNPAGLKCSHRVRAQVGSGALLVFAPDPVQCFGQAVYEQRQEFLLEPGASLVLLDWLVSGRTARGERWAFKRFGSRNEVWGRVAASQIPDALGPKGDFSPCSPLTPAIDRRVVPRDCVRSPLRGETRRPRAVIRSGGTAFARFQTSNADRHGARR